MRQILLIWIILLVFSPHAGASCTDADCVNQCLGDGNGQTVYGRFNDASACSEMNSPGISCTMTPVAQWKDPTCTLFTCCCCQNVCTTTCPSTGQIQQQYPSCACSCPAGQSVCSGNNSCMNKSCSSGYQWNDSTCKCEAIPCASTCPSTGQIQAAPPGCSCSCPAGQSVCSGNNSCMNKSCSSGYQWNDSTCKCEASACASACPSIGQIQAAAPDCSCSCPAGQSVCSGNNSCMNKSCTTTFQWDDSSCACSCPAGLSQCGGKCVDTSCSAGYKWNSFSCKCELTSCTPSCSDSSCCPAVCAVGSACNPIPPCDCSDTSNCCASCSLGTNCNPSSTTSSTSSVTTSSTISSTSSTSSTSTITTTTSTPAAAPLPPYCY